MCLPDDVWPGGGERGGAGHVAPGRAPAGAPGSVTPGDPGSELRVTASGVRPGCVPRDPPCGCAAASY